jgi:long-chain acyl-CoA synthetase
MSTAVKSPLEMFYQWERETPDQVYLRQPLNLVWDEYTWSEVADQVRRIASFLKSKAYPQESRIAIWSSNSKDWPIVDLAIMLSGHISVPLNPAQDVKVAQYIVSHSGVSLAFVGEIDQPAKVQDVLGKSIETVGMLGCSIDCNTTLEKITSQFPRCSESPVPDPDSVFTIIYTSGTTGNPKGVMHKHQTPGHVIPGLVKTFKMEQDESRLFSFLPIAHAAERIMVELTSLYANVPISFSESLATFGDEIRSVQPTFFFAVPRLWVKFKEGIDAKIPPASQPLLSAEHKAEVARELGLGEAKFILTASAPCARDVQEWFLNMGIALRDGYGMTENFTHGCAWSANDHPISGCVGQPIDDTVQVRISSAGEIQFKSKGLMKGYYLDPEFTSRAFDDGWYCSGDAGKIDKDGNLWVTGRISEVFKTSKGKFIVPTRLENLFGCSPNLAQFCIIGHGLDQPILITTLTQTGANLDQKSLKSELEVLLNKINTQIPAYERVAQICVVPEWTTNNGMLTPTLKLKRKEIETTYRPWVEQNMSGDSAINFRQTP